MNAMLENLARARRFSSLAMIYLCVVAAAASGAEPNASPMPKSMNPLVPAEPNPLVTAANDTLEGPMLTDLPTWSESLRAVVLTAIPDRYEDLSHWGKTNEIFDGVRVHQRGFQIRVSERKRTVKHGAWHRYKIELIDPAKTLKLVIEKIRPIGTSRFQFDIRLASKLRCRADFEHWLLGIKGFNMTTVSEADVQIVAHCELAIRSETHRKQLLPDIVLDPRVHAVELFLTNLDLRRIGEIRGDLAEGIGDSSRHYIENLLQAQEGRVVKKANEAIEKNRSTLRFSTSRLWASP